MLDLSKVWPEWTAEEKLGEGAYGSVYKCVRHERGITSYCAIKVITVPHDSSELDSLKLEGYTEETSKEYFNDIVDNFANEISVMENLKGFPNIVSVEDYKIVEHTDNVGWDIYIRMELLTSFKRYLENHAMTQNEVLKFGKDICTALEICEDNRIVHRDIKEDNIFVDKRGNFKLGDFGIAKQLERTRSATSHVGAYAYMAPEVSINGRCDKRADIYSLGIVMYKLLNKNRDPFLDTEKQMIRYQERVDAVNRRLDGEDLPKPVNADDAVSEIILKACKFNKEERYASAKELKAVIEGLLVSKTEIQPVKEKIQTTIQEEITEEIKPEESKAEKSETKIIPAPSKPSKINKKIIGIIAAVVAVIAVVVAGVFGIKAIKAKPGTSENDSSTSTTQNQEIVHNLYESFLESTEAKKYFEVTPAFADYYTNYEEYENYVNGISSTSKKLDYFDLDADGTDECVMSVCFVNPESINHYVFYIFDVEGETVKCVESANELYGGHRSLNKLQIYQQDGGYYIRKYIHDPHLRCGSVYKYNGKSLDFVESVYMTDENAVSYIFTWVYSDKYDLFNENAANYLAFPTEEKYNDFVTDYGIKELTEEEYYKIVGEYDNNEVYHVPGEEEYNTPVEKTTEALEIIEQGTLTKTINWILYENGLLSIEGIGAMPDFEDEFKQPWYGLTDKIIKVNICQEITQIGDYAFSYCYKITKITMGNNVTSIGDSAFMSCPELTSIEIPDSVTNIGRKAFFDLPIKDIVIPNNVTDIGVAAFAWCNNLKSITIPQNVKTIGTYAFCGCANLSEISVSDNNLFYSNDEFGVLFNKDQTILMQFPGGSPLINYTIPNTVITIGPSAFSNSANSEAFATIDYSNKLTSVHIPNSVTTIEEEAFSSCGNLTSIAIPDNVTFIGAHAFSCCENLSSVKLSSNITKISEGLFRCCDSLTTIEIPKNVTEIGEEAFEYCINLTSVSLPQKLTSIKDYVFFSCNNLTDIYYAGTIFQWEKIAIGDYNDELENVIVHYNSYL